MDNEIICDKYINQFLLRGRKFVEHRLKVILRADILMKNMMLMC